jgi:ATP-binding cassette subfamily B (MDR/TAP) protein 1
MGFISLINFSSFGLIVWYGSKLTLSRGYSGADIMIILLSVLIGARLVLTLKKVLPQLTN